MKIHLVNSALCLLLISLIPQSSQACTTFCLDKGDQLIIGYNFDWMADDGLVIVNKRNVAKTALHNPNFIGEQSPSWTSQYGSVTFNQVGQGFPFCGINETGLAITLMMLVETEYPRPDNRPSTDGSQWMQYQLDNFSKADQVIASDSQLRIANPQGATRTHYFVSDRMGNCAVIEFLNGKLVYHTKETMPVKVLANNTYDESTAFLHEYTGWGGSLPIPQSTSSLDRFVRAASMVKNYNPTTSKEAIDHAFDILTNVAQHSTAWSIVYDIKNLRIHFRTAENQTIRHMNLNSFDFSCKTLVRLLDINATLSGDITNKLLDYNYDFYRNWLRNTLNLPNELFDAISRHPESTVCMDK